MVRSPWSYVGIIGNADGRQRIQWRNGDTDTNGSRLPQNDVGLMLSTNTVAVAGPGGLNRSGVADLHLIDDGIGNTLATATPLPLVGNAIDVNSPLSKGVIVPLSESNPNPIGVSSYTQDWFSFFTNGLDAISLTLVNGTDFLVPGVTDAPLGAGNLRSTLSVYDSLGVLVGVGLEDSSTLFASYNSLLGAGTYYAQINSFGGHDQDTSINNYNPSQYYDMGVFYLTGSGFDVVPEPSSLVLVSLAIVSISLRRRRR